MSGGAITSRATIERQDPLGLVWGEVDYENRFGGV